MRKLREIRNKRGISIDKLSKATGVGIMSIRNFELNIYNVNEIKVKKLADFLETTVEEISGEIKEDFGMPCIEIKCLNQVCPLNLECKCNNDVVLEGRAPCYGKDKVQEKEKNNYRNTKILFGKIIGQ